MGRVNLHIPLGLTPHKVFYNSDQSPQMLFGYPAQLKEDKKYFYLELTNVPAGKAASVLDRARRCLKWASVRLDIGIRVGREPLISVQATAFDGQFATAYPAGTKRMSFALRKRNNAGTVTRFFAALREAASRRNFPSGRLSLACELFAAAEFEATENAQFLMFMSVLEVLAQPKRRNARCVRLVDKLLAETKAAQERAAKKGEREGEQAFKSLRNPQKHFKDNSIGGSIRRLALATSKALNDPDPKSAGKKVTALYGKRSKLVHDGIAVSWSDVTELRQLVREMLAVQARCSDRIRERFLQLLQSEAARRMSLSWACRGLASADKSDTDAGLCLRLRPEVSGGALSLLGVPGPCGPYDLAYQRGFPRPAHYLAHQIAVIKISLLHQEHTSRKIRLIS